MVEPKTRSPQEIVAYCADCNLDLAKSTENHLGQRLFCPKDEKHLAEVVKGKEGRFWLSLESKLLRYQLNWSPSHCFSSSGSWVIVRILLFLITLGFATCLPKFTVCGLILGTVLGLFVFYLVFDTLAVNTSIAFTSRFPANPLRTALLTFLSFFSVAVAFSTLFSLIPSYFCPPLNNPIRAIYFSFITIATVGYGDIKPLRDAWLPQILIVIEIMIGAYFLVILLGIVSSWANGRSAYPVKKSLQDIQA